MFDAKLGEPEFIREPSVHCNIVNNIITYIRVNVLNSAILVEWYEIQCSSLKKK